jgi:hypothetical protein
LLDFIEQRDFERGNSVVRRVSQRSGRPLRFGLAARPPRRKRKSCGKSRDDDGKGLQHPAHSTHRL